MKGKMPWLVLIFLFINKGIGFCQTRDRIYLQTDRSAYVAGEIIWFKSYLFSALTPGSLGTNLFIDLIDESGKQIHQGKVPILGGVAAGNLKLPLTLAQGVFFIRAYTKAKPSPTEYSYTQKTVYVFNPQQKSPNAASINEKLTCKFFPSSGNIVAGMVNLVYLQMKYTSGNVFEGEGTIINSKKEEVAGFKTDKQGNASFAISPELGELYQAIVTIPGGSKKDFALPPAQDNKVYITINNINAAKQCNLVLPASLKGASGLMLRGFMDDNLILEKQVNTASGQYSIKIPTAELPTGLLQMQVTDAQKQILGTAHSLVIADSSFLQISLVADTLNTIPIGKNVFHFTVPENIAGSFSVSVSDEDKWVYTKEDNIINGLLLNQDSKTKSYISSEIIPAILDKEKFALEMGTTEWRDQSLHAGESLTLNDSGYIAIQGKLFDQDTKKPINKGDLVIMYTNKDSASSFLGSTVAEDGSFKVDQLIFEGKQEFRYTLNGNKWKLLGVSIDTADLYMSMPFSSQDQLINRSILVDEVKLQQAKETLTNLRSDSISATGLKEVVVKSRVVPPKQQVNDRYTRGVFNGMSTAKVLDLINNPTTDGGNVLDFLQGEIAGLLITISGNDYRIETNRQISFSLMPPVRLFLDEFPTTIDFLKGVRAKDVALVKYYPPGMGGALPGVGIGAALVVYTRKYSDASKDAISSMSNFSVNGYMPSLDFTNDYINTSSLGISNRNTIYWNPNLYPEENKPEFYIRFNNNQSAKRFHVVVEGFTTDGRLVHLEKVLENK